jgi:hypothetical protein
MRGDFFGNHGPFPGLGGRGLGWHNISLEI